MCLDKYWLNDCLDNLIKNVVVLRPVDNDPQYVDWV